MKPRRLISAIGLVAALMLSSAAFAQSGGPVSDGVVKLGLILDLSGPYADQTGSGSETAARLAVADFGGNVLGAPIEVVVADHHNSTDRAAAIAREWFDRDHLDAIMDVAGSSEALIVQAIARNRDKIVILDAPGAVRLTEEACSPTAVHYAFNTYATARTLGRAIVRGGGDTWFFVTVDDSYGYDLERDAGAVVEANGGRVLGHVRHPLASPDFASYLLQARGSQAKVVALADAGADMTNALRQAAKLGMLPGPQTIAALSLRFSSVHALGLQIAQGMLVSEPFYWDLNDATRAWSKRFFTQAGRMPNSLQAAVYSSTKHYLEAVTRAGTDATEPVMQAMRAAPIDDFFAHDGHIRVDGVMVHDMHLFQVKTPAESRFAWDYYRLVETVPGDQAFEPLSQSKCPLVKQ